MSGSDVRAWTKTHTSTKIMTKRSPPVVTQVTLESSGGLFLSLLFLVVVAGSLASAAADATQQHGARTARSDEESTTRSHENAPPITGPDADIITGARRQSSASAEEYPVREEAVGARLTWKSVPHASIVSNNTSRSSFGKRTVATRHVNFDGPGAALSATAVPLNVLYGEVASEAPVPIQARIINGQEVSPPGRYPFMVAVVGVTIDSTGQESESFRCGGTLISADTVLSASHCYFSSGTTSNIGGFDFMRVKIGAHNIDDPQEDITVVEIIGNPNYVGNTFDNDISLLKLATPVDTNTFNPVRLNWDLASYREGTPCVVMGWGTTQNGNLSPVLMQAEVGQRDLLSLSAAVAWTTRVASSFTCILNTSS